MQEFLFSIKKMTVGYDKIPLIKDIEIGLRQGEILTLIGPNGAGKSTILKSITGQLALIAGTVLLEDIHLDGLSERERAKKMSVVLTQSIRPEGMTCEDIVCMGRYPYTGRLGILSEEDRRVVRETMDLVHIAELAERQFETLSDGQRQRVMLAKAIAQEPEVLVLDEPTSFLDIRYKIEFLSILQQMAREKKLTVLMSLHELDMAARISDKILCVKGEYVEKFGTPEEIFRPGYIEKLYGIAAGVFDESSGSAELPAIKGDPEVFVIAGNGSGASLYRRLQRSRIPFATGILWENDKDASVAAALAVKVIKERAFYPIRGETIEAAKQEMDRCRLTACTLDDFGGWNHGNEALMLYAKAQGKLVCGKEAWRIFSGQPQGEAWRGSRPASG